MTKLAWWVTVAGLSVSFSSVSASGQPVDLKAATAAIMKADTDFAKSVADRDRARFESFIAENTTFSGGTPNELRGREAVLKSWSRFLDPNGPTLTWQPVDANVLTTGDVGYTIGRSVFRVKGDAGKVTETHGEYLTVWRKQQDGTWKVVFDTGSTLPDPKP